ncbi:ATP-binding cassette domain-containing protein [Microbacterium cremeum]|uniref:ATP-binding cassette domain-containing protein n=1 Tax=Microbacterium cremeum TaxID=2782169 RepID=UPI0018890BF2|nr:ABC transporter ATP-binding protein [Microbacterium cremeum]
MIRLEQLTWSYPHAETPSLSDLDLHVRPGEFVVLCGASGSGKSTALRVMNGLIPHFHDAGVLTGTAFVGGIATTGAELDEIGALSGTVLQHPRRQFFTDSAREELAFAMENLGFPVARMRERVDALMQRLAGAVPLGQRLQQLSGGQQQQVAIAAATAHEPKVLLLDEPSSNLSADAVHRLADTLGALKADGVTIVVAEHRLRYLEHLVDRVIVMRDGRIDREWTAEQFRGVSDETLKAEGLRGEVATPELPLLPAAGASIASPAPAGSISPGTLELDGIRCRLGGRLVLEIDRLMFNAGSVNAITGVNGAGKSTLGRVVSGLQRSSGTVRLDGRVLNRGARQRATAVVMQDAQRQLFTDSVRAEIELARADAGSATGVRDMLKALDLDHLADRHPLSLSGGQQQRLVLAAARVAGRRIVIFDEPSSGVDRRHLASISEQIRQVAADGAVVILISHDDDLLALAADRQLILSPPHARWGPSTEDRSAQEARCRPLGSTTPPGRAS